MKRRRRRALPRATGALPFGLLLVLTTAGAANAARGGPGDPRAVVLVDSAACPAVSPTELRRFLGLELGELLAAPESSPVQDPGTDQLTLRCDGDRAMVRARSLGRPQILERALSLTDFPGDATARGLALAGVELLSTLDTTVRERIEGSRAAARASAGAPERASVSVAVVALRRAFLGTAGLGAWGGRLDVVRDGGRLRLTGDLEADATSTTTTLGEGRAFLSSAAGFAGVRFAPTTNLALSLSAGARAGMARLQGSPAAQTGAVGSTVWRPWWGPALAVRATLGGPRLAALATLELGVTALGSEALAAETTLLAIRGAWLTAAVGAQF